MYAVVFMGLRALNYEGGPGRFSVDCLLEQRVCWWHRIAEVERTGHTGELLYRGPVSPITPPVADPPTPASPPTSASPPVVEEPLATSAPW